MFLFNKFFKIFFVLAQVVIIINSSIADEYQYPPVKRGSSEWKSLTPEEKHQICQIPNEILIKMTTDQLIKAYLDYPFIAIIAAYSNWQDGFDRVHRDFNGLREILKRKDASQKIIQYYKNMNPEEYNKEWPLFEKGKFAVNFAYIELLLAQEIILKQMTPSEIKDYLMEGIIKYDLKKKNMDIHGLIGLEFVAFPIARLLHLSKSEITERLLLIPGIEYFLNTAQTTNDEILHNIIQLAKSY